MISPSIAKPAGLRDLKVGSRGMVNLMMWEFAFKNLHFFSFHYELGVPEKYTSRSGLKSKSNYLGVVLLTVSSDPCSTGQEHSSNFSWPLF